LQQDTHDVKIGLTFHTHYLFPGFFWTLMNEFSFSRATLFNRQCRTQMLFRFLIENTAAEN